MIGGRLQHWLITTKLGCHSRASGARNEVSQAIGRSARRNDAGREWCFWQHLANLIAVI